LRVLAISGSARGHGNTEFLLQKTLEPIAAAGIETQLVSLHNRKILPCIACEECAKNKLHCALDDDFPDVFTFMTQSDALILGSPVYFGSASPNMMALLDRAGYVARNGGNVFNRKVGAAVVVARRAGVNFTLAQLHFFFQIMGMVVPGSTYWPIAYGGKPGEVAKDEEGIKTAVELGKNVAWLLERLRA
jgi:multimeric flavodoxin WrbA